MSSYVFEKILVHAVMLTIYSATLSSATMVASTLISTMDVNDDSIRSSHFLPGYVARYPRASATMRWDPFRSTPFSCTSSSRCRPTIATGSCPTSPSCTRRARSSSRSCGRNTCARDQQVPIACGFSCLTSTASRPGASSPFQKAAAGTRGMPRLFSGWASTGCSSPSVELPS